MESLFKYMMGPNLQEECQYHDKQKSIGICFNKDCYRRGTICQECQQNYHSEHNEFIQLFNQFKQKDIDHLKQLIGNNNNTKLIELLKYYELSEEQIECRLKQMKQMFMEQFRLQLDRMNVQILSQFEKQFDQLECGFKRIVKETESVQKVIKQLDSLLNMDVIMSQQNEIIKYFNADMIQKQIDNLQKFKYGINEQNMNVDLKTDNEYNKYQQLYKIGEQRIDEFNEQMIRRMNGFRDIMVDEMQMVFIDIRRKVLGSEVDNVIKEWRDWNKDGLYPLFKVNGLMDCEFMNRSRHEQEVQNVEQFIQNKFYENIVYDQYYLRQTEYIIIESEFENGVIFTKLQKEDDRTLSDIMRDHECQQYELNYVEGEKCPLKLFGGQSLQYRPEYYGWKIQWWIKKDYLLGGGVYYYDQEGDWQDNDIGALGIQGVQGVVNGVRLKSDQYPHLHNNRDIKINVYGL